MSRTCLGHLGGVVTEFAIESTSLRGMRLEAGSNLSNYNLHSSGHKCISIDICSLAVMPVTRTLSKGMKKVGGDAGSESSDPDTSAPHPSKVAKAPPKKNGPGATKYPCHRCGANRWCIDYKEGKFADLVRTSTCLFCDIRAEASADREKVVKLGAQVAELTKNNLELSAQVQQLLDIVHRMEGNRGVVPQVVAGDTHEAPSGGPSPSGQVADLALRVSHLERAVASPDPGKGGTDVVVQAAKATTQPAKGRAASKPPAATKVVVRTAPKSAAGPDPKGWMTSDGFQLVGKGKGKEAKNSIRDSRKSTVTQSKPTASRGEPGSYLVGDSLIRRLGKKFTGLSPTNRVAGCFPGATIAKIRNSLSSFNLEKNSSLVVVAGGNDLFLRKGPPGKTELIMADYESLIGRLREKSQRGILIGILPRRYTSREALSKAIAINARLDKMCKRHCVRFADPWDLFYNKSSLFAKDGIHLSSAGAVVFGKFLNSKLFKALARPVSRPKPAAVKQVGVRSHSVATQTVPAATAQLSPRSTAPQADIVGPPTSTACVTRSVTYAAAVSVAPAAGIACGTPDDDSESSSSNPGGGGPSPPTPQGNGQTSGIP